MSKEMEKIGEEKKKRTKKFKMRNEDKGREDESEVIRRNIRRLKMDTEGNIDPRIIQWTKTCFSGY